MVYRTYFKPKKYERIDSKRFINSGGYIRLKETKKCKECGEIYYPSRTYQKFCGYKCSNAVTNRKISQKVTKQLTCLSCKKIFTKRVSDLKIYPNSLAKKKYRYCSHQCWKDKTQTVASLKKKAWLVFGIWIKNRDNWTCYTCGKIDKSSHMHAGHFISRRYNSTLFDENNVHAQCSRCNTFMNGQPHLYAERLINENGEKFLADLVAKSKEIKKFTKRELLDICKKYSQPPHDSTYSTRRGWA